MNSEKYIGSTFIKQRSQPRGLTAPALLERRFINSVSINCKLRAAKTLGILIRFSGKNKKAKLISMLEGEARKSNIWKERTCMQTLAGPNKFGRELLSDSSVCGFMTSLTV